MLEETAIKTLRFRKKLALSNFLLATVTILVVLEFIIIIALIRGAY